MSNPIASDFRVALAGNPNCGKTALFNSLTNGKQKVANYPGVTVEKREGTYRSPQGKVVRILDLPGTCSLDARTPDELVAREIILGLVESERVPDLILAVADATNLERNLGLVLELRDLGNPLVLAVNMMDLAKKRGMDLDIEALSRELGIPVFPIVAIRSEGIQALGSYIDAPKLLSPHSTPVWRKPTSDEIRSRFQRVDQIIRASVRKRPLPALWTQKIDRFVLHPVSGSVTLFLLLMLMFQAVFSWASPMQDAIKTGISALQSLVSSVLSVGPLQSLISDGMMAGIGSVLVFLPQILLLFLFILILEDSGYMARAAFLMDRVMGHVGLHGRAFIPLLSSHACAIPGIMASRTIENPRDRLVTILVAPLTACSARLPVYTLLIGAFIPEKMVLGRLNLQGLVMFGLYLAGLISALLMAFVFKRTLLRGKKPPLLLELPTYKWPSIRGVTIGLLERGKLFVGRVGTVILTLSVIIWFLASYPKPPPGAVGPEINYSFAGRVGHLIEPVIRPLGFNWKIGVALIPGFAAREVMVSALSTVYAVETKNGDAEESLKGILKRDWSVATALSLIIWYVLALQCASTLAVTRRETNSWKWPMVMLGYMTVLAYLGSWTTFHLAQWFGLGGII